MLKNIQVQTKALQEMYLVNEVSVEKCFACLQKHDIRGMKRSFRILHGTQQESEVHNFNETEENVRENIESIFVGTESSSTKTTESFGYSGIQK